MRHVRRIVPALLLIALAATGADAALFSKTYEFKANTSLKVGTDIQEGLRLDAVEFTIPAASATSSTFGGPKVKVTISNVGKTSVTVAIAIAVLNADGRLVGVASGGTKLFPLRAERQMDYTLDFGGVNGELATGTVFHLSIEPK